MKKLLTAVFAGLLLSSSFFCGEERSSGFGGDKILHFAAGFIIAEGAFRVQNSGSVALPLISTAVAGTGKELVDRNFDWLDLGSTCLGGGVRSLLTISTNQEFQIAGLTFEYDKILHFSAGFIISDITFTLQRNDSIFFPILMPALAGVGKELIDGYFDWRDFGYTVLGGVVRSTLRVTIKF